MKRKRLDITKLCIQWNHKIKLRLLIEDDVNRDEELFGEKTRAEKKNGEL